MTETLLDFPKPEVDETLPFFSNSQIGTWNTCRFKWYISYVSGWKEEKQSKPLALGNAVHGFLASYYEEVASVTRNRNVYALADNHMDRVRKAAFTAADTDELDNIRRAGGIVDRYIKEFSSYEDEDFDVLGVEQHLVFPFETPDGNTINVQLYFDLLLRDKVNDKIWLVDHKTHTSRPIGDTEAEFMPQLPLYARILREYGVDVFGSMYNLLNMYEYKDPSKQPLKKFFARQHVYHSNDQLDSILFDFLKACDDVLANKARPYRHLSRGCNMCWYKEPCLLLQKGFSEEDAFSQNFVKKSSHREDVEEDV